MRLARLDLLRYGRFTDVCIELPQAERDIHIVFGPNEAGKTTSLTAIEDLLFGIPERSTYSFLHGYEAMRVGAVLENGGARFEFLRRKTRRHMILGPDGVPLSGDERLLAPFLGGADRAYFDRMFNLSHDRLAEGGRAIIEAKDDVGQMLFAAGTGLADLRIRLGRLKEEADQLWAPHKSKDRLYYQARDRLDEAEKGQRKHSLTVNAWRTAHKTLRGAEKTLQEYRDKRAETSTELKKLARIRRMHRPIRQRRELKQEIAALEGVTELAEDAVEILARAEQQDAKAKAQADILAPQLKGAQQALEAIRFEDALVRRADEITLLNERRIAAGSARDDLPRRREEYRLELRSLARLATEIGWDFEEPSELIERIPSRSKVDAVRTLLVRDGKLTVELKGAQRLLEEARAALRDETERLEAMGEAADVSGLAAVLAAVRSIGDVAGRIHRARGQAAEYSARMEKELGSMRPALPVDTDIETLAVPPKDAIVAHRDDVRDWRRRQDETDQWLTAVRNDLERDEKALERRVRDEGVVEPGAVETARRYRDTLWDLIKIRHIAGSDIPTEAAQVHAEALEDLPASLEGAVEWADSIADRRFDQAEAAGEVAVLVRNIAGYETRIEQLQVAEAALKVEAEKLNQAWGTLWADVPVKALGVDAMLAWLEAHSDIVALIRGERDAQLQLVNARREEQEAMAQVRKALAKAGGDSEEVKADSLPVVIERADAYRREQEAQAKEIAEMRDAERRARSDMARRQSELDGAQSDQKNWRAEWTKAVAAIDLQCEDKPDVVSAQIKVIDEMRGHAATARNLRDERIATIERDIELFEMAVTKVTAELAPDLADGSADAIVLELDRRREEALKLHEQHGQLKEVVDGRQKKIEELEEGRKAGWIPVQPLMEAAGVKDVEELRKAIERSNLLRKLTKSLAGVMETLDQQSDGLAIAVVEEECRDADIDAIRVKEEEAEAELKVLDEQLEEAIGARNEARRAFEAIGGDDVAARAAADREEALAAMRDAAERYVRVRSSEMLLRWAVDRYRKEKQGPLLERAGELFKVLTRASFEKLEVSFDDREPMYLTGVRPDGEVVAVPGLSSGTEDQLFLALQIAAVEDYLARSEELPFVADDLFINFDPERSAAGFEVLGQLAERTQVLFYTHHPHLVDVARKTLGADVHVVNLSEGG